MKKYIYFLIPFAIFISSNGYSQEIDSSIIQNLTSDQIAIAEKALNNNKLAALAEENSSNKEQTLIEDCTSTSGAECSNDIEKSASNNTKFGYNFISTSPTSIIATADLPLPNEYKISIGDVIGVVLSGSKEQIFDMKVQLDGTVFFSRAWINISCR